MPSDFSNFSYILPLNVLVFNVWFPKLEQRNMKSRGKDFGPLTPWKTLIGGGGLAAMAALLFSAHM